MADLDLIAAAMRRLLPAEIALAAADPRRDYPAWPGEVLPAALPQRLREFSAGRDAARRALAALGQAPCALPQARDRAPIWPQGIRGSISHSRTACLAAVGRGQGGLGIDLAEAAPLEPALWPTVLHPEEIALLGRAGLGSEAEAAMLIFAAKEAFYKAQYPLTRRFLDFHAVRIDFPVAGGFSVTLCAPLAGWGLGAQIGGAWTKEAGHLLAALHHLPEAGDRRGQ